MVTLKGSMSTEGQTLQVLCPTLQVLDMSTLGDTTDVSPVIKFMPHTLHVCGRNLITGLTSAVSPRLDTPSTCKVGKKLGVSLPLLTCSLSALSSRLLYRRGQKSRGTYELPCISTSWFSLHGCIEMHHQQNIKKKKWDKLFVLEN